ncbi:hypothetical protein EDF52_12014 [Curtobacterium sp. PhB42]|uniref:CU044_5270 family protein n=1 Tax=unclassified Curtobacterium TaxID=257496 RepID=UPI001064494B|nr:MULTISPECIES: CU044_5270 family protein [unclassified Curtobacterium]TDW39688.1 hypothetical protein EDF52_12014 [Curtobacterium sp. PhB42]TDW50795.1 hypothetical protein EDF47_11514 [Curtobacterium sp. PhB190]
MDELTRLRSVRNDVEPASPETLARGRDILLTHIAAAGERPGATSPRSTTTRRIGWFGTGSLVAAGVAAALVAGNVLGVAGLHGGADPAAAAVLNAAALETVKTSDPAVGTGQYLEVATHAAYAYVSNADDGSRRVYLSSQNGQMYVPSDTDDEWVWVRDAQRPIKMFGPESARAAAEANPAPAEYLRAAGGAFYDSPAVVSPTMLSDLPRDPQALLDRIRAVTKGQGNSPDSEALVWIADTLRSGIVPADLRAAMFRAAALIPDIEITDRAANLDGRTGIAIGHTFREGDVQEIVIDPDTGRLIGEREVVTGKGAEEWNVPDGTAIGWTAVTTTVVDAAPAGLGK